MKRFNHTLLLLLIVSLSSCVYSLFPIYTAETLVYLNELEGDWGNEHGTIIMFSARADLSIKVEPGENEFIILDGDTITDQEAISAYRTEEFSEMLDGPLKQLKENGYLMQIIENEDTINFNAKVAKIGTSFFLDLSPVNGFSDDLTSRNLFPVHTFMKLSVNQDQLVITPFKLDKLLDLFESNRIRLRHEEVDGNVLITAQPEEIQKFLAAYSKNDAVFDTNDIYARL